MKKIILLFDIAEHYGRSLLKGIVKYSKENGTLLFYRMPIYYRETLKMQGIIKFAKEWGAQGIIGQLYNDRGIDLALKAGLYLIGEDFKERFTNIPNITGGYHEAGKMGAEYFLKKGFKNFAFYGYTNIVWSRERFEGYENFLEERGLSVFNFDQVQLPGKDIWYYQLPELSKWLKSLPKPIAIMACDDDKAQHLAEACKQAAIPVPEEVAILGVDNDEMTCNLSDPPLSSINLNSERAGYEAARLIDTMIEQKIRNPYNIYVKPTHIITRQSTDIFSAHDQHIVKSLKFIHQHLDDTINVSQVLKEVPLCRRSFEMRFKETTGTSVYQYINKLKIQMFSERLLNTDKSVSEIALDMGFVKSNNIARLFKQVKGCTPTQYLLMHVKKS